MSMRIRAAGLRIGYCPGAMVYHEVDPARADRARFIRIARERGRCRMLHEGHGRAAVLMNVAYAGLRLGFARVLHAPAERVAREDRRLATALGMLDGLRQRPASNRPPGASPINSVVSSLIQIQIAVCQMLDQLRVLHLGRSHHEDQTMCARLVVLGDCPAWIGLLGW